MSERAERAVEVSDAQGGCSPRPPRIARGPWLGLILVGTVLWGAYRLAKGSEAGTVVITSDTVVALREGFVRQHDREPTIAELDALIDEQVELELLVREARARGLDRADPIVRRRLVQKLRFVLEDADGVDDPGDAVLEAWVRDHADRYRRAPRRGFTHVFVAGRDAAAEARAQALADELARGSDPTGLGDAFPHGSRQGPADPRALADRYGDALAQAVSAAPLERWITTPSSFGWHVLRVDDERPGGLSALAEIRARVLADWQLERRATSLARGLVELRARYRVEVER